MKRQSNKGFTLVEILIVVIILGILASIVVAQFTNVRGSTSDTALKDDLRWLRSAVQLYQIEHGRLPTLASFDGQMTQFTDMNGTVGAQKDATYKFGSYVYQMPILPVGAQIGKRGVTGPAYTAGYGWQYDETTGTVTANCDTTEHDADGKAYNTY